MKLLSELYQDSLKMWSDHHAQITQHLTEMMQLAEAAQAQALKTSGPAGLVVGIGEDALAVVLKRLDALEAKLNAQQGTQNASQP